MKIKIIFLAIFTTFLFGCSEDYLDVTNPNKITSETFWVNSDNALKGLTSVYAELQFRYHINGAYGQMLRDGMSDEILARPSDPIPNFIHTTFTSGGTRDIPAVWTSLYISIFRANQVIEYTPDIEMDEGLKNKIIAEAKFLRAYNYFVLAKTFKRPPLILEVPKAREDYFPSQVSDDESPQHPPPDTG